MNSAYQVPPDVAYIIIEPSESRAVRVFLLRMPDGDPQTLVGISALIWIFAMEGAVDVAAAVAAAVSEPIDQIGPTIDAFLADLVNLGMLASNG